MIAQAQDLLCPYDPGRVPWQIEPLHDTSPVVVLTGSAGGGKSRVEAEKMHAFCYQYPGATCAIGRKTRESLRESCIAFMNTEVIGGDKRINFNKTEGSWTYPNGSRLITFGLKNEEQRAHLKSIGQRGGLDRVWIEEATQIAEADHNLLRTRMRGKAAHWRQITYTTNPGSPTHWIYVRLILGGEAKVYYSSAADNTTNPDDYQDSLDSLTGVDRDRLRDGKWTHAEGAVYPEFNANDHVINRFEIPAGWKRTLAIDWGFNNPKVAQWWAQDYDGRAYLYREIYMSQLLTPDFAKQVMLLSAEEQIHRIVGDHDLEERKQFEKVTGWRVKPARKDVSVGIQAVKERLKVQGDGKARLFVLRNSLVAVDRRLAGLGKPTCFLEEIPGYRNQPVIEGRLVKEEPVKEDDHSMDTLRYFIMEADAPSRKAWKRDMRHARV